MKKLNYWISILSSALQVQISLGIGLILCLACSLFYLFLNDPSYPKENPWPLVVGIGLSFGAYLIGKFIARRWSFPHELSLKRGALIVILSWIIGCTISAIVFMLFGFPDPVKAESFSLIRRFVDGFFESMSGFTTSGDSILAHIEIFPRSVLLWRSVTIWIGGMGIVFFGLTVLKHFSVNRAEVMNGEAESPDKMSFPSEKAARESGLEFLQAYIVISVILTISLIVSGMFFRATPYRALHENVYDALIHMGSAMGTGGFSNYDNSAAGLQNPVSEWLLAIFMVIGGSNFALWYFFVIRKQWKKLREFKELRYYLLLIAFVTLSIWAVLMSEHTYLSIWDSLRNAFFAVSSVISTAGLATQDFAKWPVSAQGLLFICYLVGAMVGSTGGGLKVKRFLIFFEYAKMELQNMIYGRKLHSFEVDGTTYTAHDAGLVMVNMFLYYLLFLVGGILLMIVSKTVVMADGTTKEIDFTAAFTASLASIGNIGPAIVKGNIDSGPAGNYFAYSVTGKVVLTILMFIGRIGVLNALLILAPERKLEEK